GSTSNASPTVLHTAFVTNTPVSINVSPTPKVGVKTTITAGTYSPTPSHSSYQWKRCDSSGNNCVKILGATYPTYKPVAADVGKRLRVVETVTKSLYPDGGS